MSFQVSDESDASDEFSPAVKGKGKGAKGRKGEGKQAPKRAAPKKAAPKEPAKVEAPKAASRPAEPKATAAKAVSASSLPQKARLLYFPQFPITGTHYSSPTFCASPLRYS